MSRDDFWVSPSASNLVELLPEGERSHKEARAKLIRMQQHVGGDRQQLKRDRGAREINSSERAEARPVVVSIGDGEPERRAAAMLGGCDTVIVVLPAADGEFAPSPYEIAQYPDLLRPLFEDVDQYRNMVVQVVMGSRHGNVG